MSGCNAPVVQILRSELEHSVGEVIEIALEMVDKKTRDPVRLLTAADLLKASARLLGEADDLPAAVAVGEAS